MGKQYWLQRGEDLLYGKGYDYHDKGYPPRVIDALPADVPTLEEGDWKYSELLQSWVGHKLTHERAEKLYWRRVC